MIAGVRHGRAGIIRRRDRREPDREPPIDLGDEPREPAGERWPEPEERRIGWWAGPRRELAEPASAVVVADPQDRQPLLVEVARLGQPDQARRRRRAGPPGG